MWRINGSAKTPLPKEEIGKFYSGDCYVVLYTHNAGDRKEDYFLCCWIGKDSLEVSNVRSDYVIIQKCLSTLVFLICKMQNSFI